MLQTLTLLAALAAQSPDAAGLEHGAVFPEGRYVERDADGALQCANDKAGFITIRVRQVERHDEIIPTFHVGRAGLVSFNLDADPQPQPLYAISDALTPLDDYHPGDTRIEAARITTAGRYTDSVFDGSTTGGLSVMLKQHPDGDIEIIELWENDRRGVRSAALPDRVLVAVNAGFTGGGLLNSDDRVLRRFAACPDLPR